MIQVNKIETSPNELPDGLVWYVIGQPKSAKTTQLSKWSKKGHDGVIVIDTDLGSDFVQGANSIPCIGLTPPLKPVLMDDGTQARLPDGTSIFEKDDSGNYIPIPPEERGYLFRSGPNRGKPMPVYALTEIAQWLLAEWDNLPYDTILLDTIDKVNAWNEVRTCAKMGISAMGQAEWGADWADAKEGVLRTFTLLRDLMRRKAGNLIIVSHAKETTTTPAKGNKKAVRQLGPALPSGLATKLLGDADVIGYTTGDDGSGTYKISFEAYDEVKVGSRLRAIAQKELPFDYNEIMAIIKAYGKEEAND
jgi:hypothetical protein